MGCCVNLEGEVQGFEVYKKNIRYGGNRRSYLAAYDVENDAEVFRQEVVVDIVSGSGF